MLVHPGFDPIALSVGPIAIRWYGLMYLAAFGFVWWLGTRRINQGRAPIERTQFDDMLFYGILGVIVGGRLGYVIFYKAAYFLQHPLEVFAVWQGGMSFHGGFLGVLIAMAWFSRKNGKHWLDIMDFVAPLVPLGLAAGRLGNFINGELWGRVTDVAWGMVFRGAGPAPRHPSQLYEMLAEGLLLFVVLWLYSSKPRPRGAVSGLFLAGYGVGRFLCEYTREPDDFLGLLALNMSMGQWLSAPMIVAGIAMMAWAYRKPVVQARDGHG
jgi:phosphatidylglycerol:prolipoprotein diacylglycerol transferase